MYEIPNLRFSLPAGEAIARRRFVTVDSNGAAVIAESGEVIGASTTQAATGEAVDIADGIVMVEASAIIAAGANVSATTDGKAVTATAASQSTDSPYTVTPGSVVAGVALSGASAAGIIIAVKLK